MKREPQSILLLPKLTAFAAVIYAFATLFEWLIARDAGMARGDLAARSAPGLIILCASAAIYGLARVVQYHPACRPPYWKWLEAAPWRAGMPLPLGPVTLDWRDVLVLAPAALAAHYVSGGLAVAPLLAFGVSYLLALGLSETRARWWAVALLAGFAGMLRLSDHPYAVAAAMLPMYALALGGLRYAMPQLVKPMADGRPEPSTLGAPFEQLAPIAPPKPVPLYRAVAAAGLTGWWAYCVIWRIWSPRGTVMDQAVVVLLAGLGAALIRFIAYRGGSNPPLSLAGRWRTGRWIIPGYDSVYLMPLVTLLVSLATGGALIAAGAKPAAMAGLTVGLATLVAVVLPPTRARWQLTAERQIDRGVAAAGKYVKLA